LRESVSIS